MDEEDDDIYAPDESFGQQAQEMMDEPTANSDAMDEDDDEEDSDIEIVTETKEGDKSEPPSSKPRPETLATLRNAALKSETPALVGGRGSTASPLPKVDIPTTSTPISVEAKRSGASYPAIRTSSIDVDAKPVHEASGKPITEIDIDTDIGENDKPWRLPGADQTDYFNYGFDEFTWAAYCLKQKTLRDEAQEQKKQIEEMQNMFGGTTGSSANASASAGMMPNMGEMTPDMQAAMQAMMTSGVDPSQMDFSMFMSMMNPGAQGMGQQGFSQPAQPQQQQMGGYGYGHEGGRGGNRGRGRRW